MKPKRLSGFQTSCQYNTLEGVKFAQESELEKEGPTVTFDTTNEVIVNASMVRVQCTAVKSKKKDYFFLHLPYRPLALAQIKETLRKKYKAHYVSKQDHSGAPKNGTTSSSSSSSPSTSSASSSFSSSSSSPSSSSPPVRPLNVYVLGIDSVSHSQSLRHLKKLRSYLLSPEIEAIEYYAYNKVALNTIPNWAAMHTGWHRDSPGFKEKRHIWTDYAEKGFWTMMGDDWETTKWAFESAGHLLDYRYKIVADARVRKFEDMKKYSRAQCFRGRRFGDIEQEWFLNFLDAHRNFSQDNLFTWIWHSDWSHDILNGVKMADEPTKKLLQTMKAKGDLDKGIMIFLSDHGFRQTKFAQSSIGVMENNLPYLFLLLPKWFKEQFPQFVANAKLNTQRLVSTFDIHKTLEHLLHIQTNASEWRNDFPDYHGNKTQESFSLLTEIPLTRTCDQAGIPDIYCSCFQLKELDLGATKDQNVKLAEKGGIAMVTKINEALNPHLDICFKWKFSKLVKVKKKPKENKFMIRIEAVADFDDPKNNNSSSSSSSFPSSSSSSSPPPITGVFDGWVATKDKDSSFEIQLKEISRQDRYGPTSGCILQKAFALKEYCRCREV